jgi:hypothetical protein
MKVKDPDPFGELTGWWMNLLDYPIPLFSLLSGPQPLIYNP